MRTTKLLLALAILMIANAACANYLGDVVSDRGAQAWLSFEDYVHISFSYKVDDPAGARIQALPYTGEYVATPYAAAPSPLYTGEGAGTSYCRVTGGERLVTHIKLSMYSADWSETLLEIMIPVDYHYGAKGITDLELSDSSPSWLMYGENLVFTHGFSTDVPGIVFARPTYQGALVPHYSASGGDHIDAPHGNASHFFHIDEGAVDVDAILFQFWNESLTELLWQAFVPVDLHWREHGLSNFRFDYPSPSYLAHDERVTCEFDYSTSDPDGVRIWMVGAVDGVPQYLSAHYQGSVLLPAPGGTISRYFMHDEDVDITDAYVWMKSADGSETYLEVYVPVDLRFRAHSINRVVASPGAPAILDFGERVYIDFDYYTSGANDLRIAPFGASNGFLVMPQFNSGSPLYPAPSGSGSAYFGYSEEDSPVLFDDVAMLMRDDDTGEDLLWAYYPIHHYYGSAAVVTTADDAPPALRTALLPNHPNPFNPKTTIGFNLSEGGAARLEVFDARGRLVRTLLDRRLAAGAHAIDWDGRDDRGAAVTSGVYFSRLTTAREDLTRKMVLVR